MHTLSYINSSQKIILEGLSNDLRGQMSPKVVHSSPDLPPVVLWNLTVRLAGRGRHSCWYCPRHCVLHCCRQCALHYCRQCALYCAALLTVCPAARIPRRSATCRAQATRCRAAAGSGGSTCIGSERTSPATRTSPPGSLWWALLSFVLSARGHLPATPPHICSTSQSES